MVEPFVRQQQAQQAPTRDMHQNTESTTTPCSSTIEIDAPHGGCSFATARIPTPATTLLCVREECSALIRQSTHLPLACVPHPTHARPPRHHNNKHGSIMTSQRTNDTDSQNAARYPKPRLTRGIQKKIGCSRKKKRPTTLLRRYRTPKPLPAPPNPPTGST